MQGLGWVKDVWKTYLNVIKDSVVSKYDTLIPKLFWGQMCIGKKSHHLCPKHLISNQIECEVSRMEAMVWNGGQLDGL